MEPEEARPAAPVTKLTGRVLFPNLELAMKQNFFRYFALAFVFTLIGTFFSPLLTCGTSSSNFFLNADPASKLSPAVQQAVVMENAFQEVFDKVSPAVVSIATERTVNIRSPFGNGDPMMEYFFGRGQRPGGKSMQQKQTGLGSGIILNEDGYVLTNHHVIANMDKLTVRLKNKKQFEAELVGSDPLVDIALLKVKASKSDLQPVVIGDSDKVRVGNWAIAIGAPLGLEQSFTVGVISAIQRGGIDNSGVSYLQTDASINQGNSGGPLLNIHGEVIGINRMIVSQSGGNVGIGLSIPINDAKRIAEDLKKNGKVVRPWLGVGLDAIAEEDADELGIKPGKGALVRQVVEGSPADRAGIRTMDVITEVDGKEVKGPEDVVTYVRGQRVGKKIDMKITREKKQVFTSVTLREQPN